MPKASKGHCKLTGNFGVFVASHLLPKAVTRPRAPGLPFVESGNGKRPIRRWDSWWDAHLVIRKGEDILASLDNWAIAELRKQKLIWSGWGPDITLQPHTAVPGTGWGIREIITADRSKLRLFFLSLLWRAAATERPEFAEVSLPPDDLEQLRVMLLTGDPGDISFYPAMLTQLSTRGEAHNLTPIRTTKSVPSIDGSQKKNITSFRFYFEGLIVHMHDQANDDGYTDGLGKMVVGAEDRLTISTVTYETSFQKMNLDRLVAEARHQWPDQMNKLY